MISSKKPTLWVFWGRVLSPGLRAMADCFVLSRILVQVCQQVISRPWWHWSSERWEILGSRMVWSCLWDGAPGYGQGWSSVGAGVFFLWLSWSPSFFVCHFQPLFQSSSGCYCSRVFQNLVCLSVTLLVIWTSGHQLYMVKVHIAKLSLRLRNRTEQGK